MVSTDDLATYVNKPAGFSDPDEAFAELVLEAATESINALISESADVPQSVYDLAVMTVASELWHRRNMPGGVMQTGADGTGAIRLTYDVTRMVRPLLAPYSVAI